VGERRRLTIAAIADKPPSIAFASPPCKIEHAHRNSDQGRA
jgi:hypothetical protein